MVRGHGGSLMGPSCPVFSGLCNDLLNKLGRQVANSVQHRGLETNPSTGMCSAVCGRLDTAGMHSAHSVHEGRLRSHPVQPSLAGSALALRTLLWSSCK